MPPLWSIHHRIAGTSAGSATRITVSFMSSVTRRLDAEPGLLETTVDRRLVGPDRGDHAMVVAAAVAGPGRDHPETVLHQRRRVRTRAGP